MKEPRVASRYAKSLLLLASERGSLEVVNEDMATIRKAVKENKELALVINSPVIKADKKGAIFKAVFEGKISALTEEFIAILVRKKREYLVDDMAEAFDTQYKIFKGTVTANVTTAVPMDDEQRQKVLDMIRDMQGNQDIFINEKVDANIIGGIIIQVGDIQLDESVSRKLADYRKQFSKNQYVADF